MIRTRIISALLILVMASSNVFAGELIEQEIAQIEETPQQRIIKVITEKYRIALHEAEFIVNNAFILAAKKALNPYEVVAIMDVESNFNRKAKSYANAVGLMQVHYPSHSHKVGGKMVKLYDPAINMEIGTNIWSYCRTMYKSYSMASHCYSGGHAKWPHEVKKMKNFYEKVGESEL